MDSTHIYTVYRATNTVNGKVYIGFDSAWPKRQIYHKCVYKKPSVGRRAFYDALKKYGWNAFVWDVIYQSKDGEHCLNVMEPHFITEHHSLWRRWLQPHTGW